MTIGWRRRILYGATTALLVLLSGMAALLAADIYVHARVQNLGGVNLLHRAAEGNQRIAERLVEPVRDLLSD